MADERGAKPAWWRCPACKTRVWNDPIDKEAHRGACPADLKHAIKALAGRIERLERKPDPEPVQLEADFGPDLESVDEGDLDGRWPEEPVEEPVEEPEPTEAPAEVPDVTPVLPAAAAYYEGPRAIDEYDDEDDEEEASASISRGVMR